MKVRALKKVWFGSYEWLPGAEFDYDDGEDLDAAIAVGLVKPVDEETKPPREDYKPWSE